MPNKTYADLKKRILNLLGEYSCEGECFVLDNNRQELLLRMPEEINASLVRMYTSLPMSSQKPVIDENTHDSFDLGLDELEFETLCCLTASNLCLADEAELYTRLIYKYNDLSQGIYNRKCKLTGRCNSFYCVPERSIVT